MHRHRWLAVAALGVTAGCSGSPARPQPALPSTAAAAPSTEAAAPAPVSTPALLAKGSVVTDPNGFAVDLPDGWTAIADTTQISDLLKKGAAADPGLGESLQRLQKSIAANETIFAAKTATIGAGDFADNVNVNVSDASGLAAADIGRLAGPALKELVSIGATVSGHSSITAAGQPALQVTYTLKETTVLVQGTQVYLVHGDKVFVTTISEVTRHPALDAAIIAGLHFAM